MGPLLDLMPPRVPAVCILFYSSAVSATLVATWFLHTAFRSRVVTLSKLQDFCRELQQHVAPACHAGQGAPGQAAECHVLLISGGGRKKAVDTVIALQHLAASKKQKKLLQPCQASQRSAAEFQQQPPLQQQLLQRQQKGAVDQQKSNIMHQGSTADTSGTSTTSPRPTAVAEPSLAISSELPSLAVAFNPYLPDEQEWKDERERLWDKLATGLVDRIYLQVCKCPRIQYQIHRLCLNMIQPPELPAGLH